MADDLPVHDLGGRSGFGAVPVDDSHVFAADWERRAFGVTQYAQSLAGFNTDAFRHGIERETSARYSSGYWQRWLWNAERMLTEGGVLPPGAVDARIGNGGPPDDEARRTTDATPHGERGNVRTIDADPRFRLGDEVRTVAAAPHGGHHRLPGYVWGKTGRVTAHHGAWVFPDTHAHGRGEQPRHVYTVAFASTELWPAEGDGPVHRVRLDLFEPYLEPA